MPFSGSGLEDLFPKINLEKSIEKNQFRKINLEKMNYSQSFLVEEELKVLRIFVSLIFCP